ncbi:hypothetical protein TNCV_4440151 [Trichonephila clavipes]|nr:hypothetical protein TNCV_4440151 [Trichonephila clavipes]
MECLASFPLSTRVGCCFVREKAIDLRTRPTHSTWSVVPIIDSFLGEFLTQWTVFGLIVLRSEIILLAANAKHDVEKHKDEELVRDVLGITIEDKIEKEEYRREEEYKKKEKYRKKEEYT